MLSKFSRLPSATLLILCVEKSASRKPNPFGSTDVKILGQNSLQSTVDTCCTLANNINALSFRFTDATAARLGSNSYPYKALKIFSMQAIGLSNSLYLKTNNWFKIWERKLPPPQAGSKYTGLAVVVLGIPFVRYSIMYSSVKNWVLSNPESRLSLFTY